MNAKNRKRLLKDVLGIMKDPLDKDGIYYQHDQTNMLKGYAMIIGPSDTIYNYGFYFFEFKYPKEYPYVPPKVIYHTNNNDVRMHPNLYRNGKVCLSLLNTWRGEQWTSCQSIKTILLTLITLFTNKPLLSEPGIKESYKHFGDYNEIIRWANLKISVLDILNNKICLDFYERFKKNIQEEFEKNKDKIKENIELLSIANTCNKKSKLFVPLYSMNILCNYDILKTEIKKIIKLKN